MYRFIFAMAMLMAISSCQPPYNPTVDRTVFPQSVASGDPGATSVVLWTRYEGMDLESVPLRWQVAPDSQFTRIVQEGNVTALPAKDFTVRVIADALQPGTTYYYRFTNDQISSPIGRTKTLPETADRIVLGLANCAKYEGGYYHAYAELANMDELDAVVHLGDYIYENPVTTSGSYLRGVTLTGRKHEPEHEIITIEDYRTRYKQYRSDPDLQRLHERHAMINIWDDHEFANNAWQDGAGGHDDEEDGDWSARKQTALQAYYEWIPIRGNEQEPIYRTFDFADVVSLHMLDTRLCCRNRAVTSTEDRLDPTSTIVGPEQMNWLFDEIADPVAHWNVIGNQVRFSLAALRESHSLDKWGGYMTERDQVVAFMEENVDRNVVFITGDAHSGYDFTIPGSNDQVIADEFLLGSISSTNLDEGYADEPERVAEVIAAWEEMDDPHVKWFDLTEHGFMTLDITPDSLTASWYRLSTIVDSTYTLSRPYYRTVASRR